MTRVDIIEVLNLVRRITTEQMVPPLEEVKRDFIIDQLSLLLKVEDPPPHLRFPKENTVLDFEGEIEFINNLAKSETPKR